MANDSIADFALLYMFLTVTNMNSVSLRGSKVSMNICLHHGSGYPEAPSPLKVFGVHGKEEVVKLLLLSQGYRISISD